MCFLERPGLTRPDQVADMCDQYLAALVTYEKWRRSRKERFLPRLVERLTNLRTLSQVHADVLFSLKIEHGSLPPLLSEYFDVV